MPLTITHSTPADGTFSATGATAWNANHSFTVSGTSGELQYNNAGDFAGMSGTSWNDTNRALTLTGATVTASAPVLDVSQTWNNSGVTFTGLRFNAAGASDAGSLLLDLQFGGSSKFAFRKDGLLTINYPTSGSGVRTVGNGNGFVTSAFGSDITGYTPYGPRLQVDNTIEWSTSSTGLPGASVILRRRATANLQLGSTDAAAPVAQTLSVQSVVAGTTNTAGANLTITGSQGTGTGAGGSIVFQVAPAGSSGTAQNALSPALTLTSSNDLTLGASGNGQFPVFRLLGTDGRTVFMTARNVGGNSGVLGIYANTQNAFIQLATESSFSTSVMFGIDAANTLALRNGTNAQTFNIYGSFTSASVYKRLALSSTTTVATVAAETDTGDMDLALTPAGAGRVRYGTHSAIGAETVTGYIEIKDAGGTVRKLAVVS